MLRNKLPKAGLLLIMAAVLAIATAGNAFAMIEGITGDTFNFTAADGHIQAGDGRSVYIWGYSDTGGLNRVQYPGPTLKIQEGTTVTINLTNNLPVNTSMIFPGMSNVGVSFANITSSAPGALATEVVPGGTATYTFTASAPGTYYYQSATNPDLQLDMGLFGAIIVYPGDNPEIGGTGRNGGALRAPENLLTYDYYAYNDTGQNDWNTFYDVEFLFLESEMDPGIHEAVEDAVLANPTAPDLSAVDTSTFFANYWFLNGRNAPDTMLPDNAGWMPNQPYSCMPMMYPGERLLMRTIDVGRDLHPYHHHGNHARIVAQDGRLLTTGVDPDLSYLEFTITNAPGQTADAIFQWTGEGIGFDVYGHTDPGQPLQPYEDASVHGLIFPDTGTPLPTPVPHQELLAFGQFYSGSPFLGSAGELPPGEGGFNPNSGYTYMWHSHNEKEMVNNNIFPGGLMTIMFVEPWPAP